VEGKIMEKENRKNFSSQEKTMYPTPFYPPNVISTGLIPAYWLVMFILSAMSSYQARLCNTPACFVVP
jgi:hypothetical protein